MSGKKREYFAANFHYQYYFGWTCGAGHKPIDSARAQHENAEMREAYNLGWKHGREAARNASEWATKKWGYKPSILRVQDTEAGQ